VGVELGSLSWLAEFAEPVPSTLHAHDRDGRATIYHESRYAV
jgi:hypothetical protein